MDFQAVDCVNGLGSGLVCAARRTFGLVYFNDRCCRSLQQRRIRTPGSRSIAKQSWRGLPEGIPERSAWGRDNAQGCSRETVMVRPRAPHNGRSICGGTGVRISIPLAESRCRRGTPVHSTARSAYRREPLSTRTIDPVVCVKWVTQAITALATSSASTARFNGVAATAAAIISSVRPRHEAGMDHPRRNDDNADLGRRAPEPASCSLYRAPLLRRRR